MSDQPDQSPPFAVRISASAIAHIRGAHVHDPREGPLWTELLGPTGDLSSALESLTLQSLQRPFFVQYDQHDEHGAFLHTTRECVARVGIVVVLRLLSEQEGEVITAYFPYETYDAKPSRRWLRARQSRIELYGGRVTFGQAQWLPVPPLPGDVFPSPDPPGDRRNVRFVDAEHWGIREASVGDSTCLAFTNPPPWPQV